MRRRKLKVTQQFLLQTSLSLLSTAVLGVRLINQKRLRRILRGLPRLSQLSVEGGTKGLRRLLRRHKRHSRENLWRKPSLRS
jgi:hypothetical protein